MLQVYLMLNCSTKLPILFVFNRSLICIFNYFIIYINQLNIYLYIFTNILDIKNGGKFLINWYPGWGNGKKKARPQKVEGNKQYLIWRGYNSIYFVYKEGRKEGSIAGEHKEQKTGNEWEGGCGVVCMVTICWPVKTIITVAFSG